MNEFGIMLENENEKETGKKKIVLVYDFLSEVGGLERVMVFQANVLSEKYEVVLAFAFVDDVIKKDMYDKFGLNKNVEIIQFVDKFNSENKKVSWLFLHPKILKKVDGDVFISHSFICTAACYFSGKKYYSFLHHPPNFLYFENADEKKEWMDSPKRKIAGYTGMIFGSFLRAYDKKVVSGAKGLFVNSKYTRKRIKEIYDIGAKVMYPPVSSVFRVVGGAEVVLDVYKLNRNFVYAHGRIIPDKRYDWIVECFDKVNSDYNLVISGMVVDDVKSKLLNLIEKKGLGCRVKFLGKIPTSDLVKLYNCARVFVLAAPKEDFGIVPIEAMACGCPVVAWDDGAGPSESVVDGETGLLAKPYDLDDLADKINKVAVMDYDSSAMIENARRFSEEECKLRLLDVFDD